MRPKPYDYERREFESYPLTTLAPHLRIGLSLIAHYTFSLLVSQRNFQESAYPSLVLDVLGLPLSRTQHLHIKHIHRQDFSCFLFLSYSSM